MADTRGVAPEVLAYEDEFNGDATLVEQNPRLARSARSLSLLAGAILTVLIVAAAIDISARTSHRSGVPGLVEWSEVGIVYIVFLALTGAEFNDRHIRTPLVTNRLPARLAHALRALVSLISVAFLVWMAVETTSVAMDSVRAGEYRYGLAHVPVWPARLIIPVGLTALAGAIGLRGYHSIRLLLSNAPHTTVRPDSTL